jgi:hypothetical protein
VTSPEPQPGDVKLAIGAVLSNQLASAFCLEEAAVVQRMQHKGAGLDESPLISPAPDTVPDFNGPLGVSCSELAMPDVSFRQVSWYAWVQKKATTATFCNAIGSKQIQQRPLPPMLFGTRPPLLPPFLP